MNIDATHRPWLIGCLLASCLAVGAWVVLPAGPTARTGPGVLFGLAGTMLALPCALLPVRRRLQRVRRLTRWRLLRAAVWEKGHIYCGLCSGVLLHCHAAFRVGGPLTAILLLVLWAILLSGVAGLLFRHLLPLVKTAKEGKGLRAAQLIGALHGLSLRLHVPLTVTLFVLVLVHAVVVMRY